MLCVCCIMIIFAMPSLVLSLDSNNKNFIDPEINMDCSELVTSKGIPHERHNVTTEDGFVLGMDRLPKPNSKKRFVLKIC